MDIQYFTKLITDFQKQGIKNFKFSNNEQIILVISGLRGLRQYSTAIELYEKYESDLKNDELYPAALTNIVEVCNDFNETELLIKYTRQLKAIYPDHPYVIEISKHHSI